MAAVAFGNALTRCGFLNTTKLYFEGLGLTAEALQSYTGEDYALMVTGMKYFTLPNGHDVVAAAKGPLIIAPHAMQNLKGFQCWLTFRKLRGQQLSSGSFVAGIVPDWLEREATLYRESQGGMIP